MLPSNALEVRGLRVGWNGVPVVDDVDLTVAQGEFVTLMGPNGSGKTTLLRAIAGFESPEVGEIRIGGSEVRPVPAHRRGIGLVFQESTMLPGRTVWENVAFAPELQHRPAAEIDRTVSEMLDRLHLTSLAERPADALSGGERQRVALARALAARPRVVLLDEPFASVDPELRAELRSEFREVLRRAGASVLHVTHDREEGLFLGDRVLLLDAGRIVQAGTPTEVFRSPRTPSVARFLGYNVGPIGGSMVAVHPLDVDLAGGAPGIPARIVAAGPVGRGWVAYAELDSGARWECRGPDSTTMPAPGDRCWIRWRTSVPLGGGTVKDLPTRAVVPP